MTDLNPVDTTNLQEHGDRHQLREDQTMNTTTADTENR